MSKRINKGLQEGDSIVHKVPFNQKMYFGLSIAEMTFISRIPSLFTVPEHSITKS